MQWLEVAQADEIEIADALDLEPGRKRRGGRRAHRFGNSVGPDPLGALRAGHVRRLDDGARRRSSGTHDETGPFVGDLVRLQPAVADSLIHRNVVPSGSPAMKTHRATIDHLFRRPGSARLAPGSGSRVRRISRRARCRIAPNAGSPALPAYCCRSKRRSPSR